MRCDTKGCNNKQLFRHKHVYAEGTFYLCDACHYIREGIENDIKWRDDFFDAMRDLGWEDDMFPMKRRRRNI